MGSTPFSSRAARAFSWVSPSETIAPEGQVAAAVIGASTDVTPATPCRCATACSCEGMTAAVTVW